MLGRFNLKQLFLAFSSILLFGSCSYFLPESALSLLPSFSESSSKNRLAFELIGEKPYLFKRVDSSSLEKDFLTFFTAVQECKEGLAKSNLATTRQLLVGLKELEILSQESVGFKDKKALYTLSTAKLGSDPITLAIYSIRSTECINDFIVWFAPKSDALPEKDTVEVELSEIKPYLEDNFSLKGGADFAEETD